MELVRRIFGGVDRAYLIRAYVIGIVLFAAYAWFVSQGTTPAPTGIYVYFAISTLLFPFSKLVWDEIMSLMLGRNMFVMNAVFMIVIKLFINVLLWGCAVFVAPLGILWLWHRTREG